MTDYPKGPSTDLPLLPLGTKTEYGTIEAIHSHAGEREYFCKDRHGVVSMIPAELIAKATGGEG